MVAPRTLVIVNPASGRGATRRRWRRLEPRVREALGGVEIEHTRAAGDARRLAREAVRAGLERIVVAGGDGSWAEVASGLLGAGLGGYAELGLLPMGTGSDFARSVGVPSDPEAALAVLVTGSARRVDAGVVELPGGDGAAPRRAWFLNVASFGVSSLAVELAARAPRALGGRAAFALGTARALLRHRSEPVRLVVDGASVLEEPSVLVAVANGRCFGGGMRIAPDARLDDGRFDVVAAEGRSAWSLLPRLPKLYRGTHLSDPLVRSWRGARVEAEAPAGPVPLELDGEPFGRLPARFELLPGALAVIGPKA